MLLGVRQYNIKLVRSGNILEFYNYEESLITGLPMNKKGRAGSGEIDDEQKDINKKRGVQRAKEKFIRTINANPDLVNFLTLTFKADIRDIEIANTKFYNPFIKRVQTRYPNFKAIGVTEFQDKNRNGVIHYHLLVNLFLSPNEWRDLWQWKTYRRRKIKIEEAGNIDLRWGQNNKNAKSSKAVDNIGLYMVNGYMKKTFSDERLEGFKKYKRHGKLNKPEEFSFKDIEELNQFLNNHNISLEPDKVLKFGEYDMKGRENKVNFVTYNLSKYYSRKRVHRGSNLKE